MSWTRIGMCAALRPWLWRWEGEVDAMLTLRARRAAEGERDEVDVPAIGEEVRVSSLARVRGRG